MFVQVGRGVQRPIWRIVSLLVILSLIGIYWFQNTEDSPDWLSQSMDVDTKIKRFLNTWCKVRSFRTNWEQILRTCSDNMESSYHKEISEERTSATASQIVAWDIRPAGEFSKLWIRSKLDSGEGRNSGGDSWRAHLTGPSSPVVSIFDQNNGTYEAIFLPIEHGAYKAEFTLEHSNCDGLKEPPRDWFVKGNAQGRGQKDGILGSYKAYIGQRMGERGWNFQFEVPHQLSMVYIKEMARILFGTGNICSESCNLIWDGYGRWINKTWEPYRVGEDYASNTLSWTRKRNGILWFYGDSVMEQFHTNIFKKGNLCQGYSFKCGHTYNWVYRIENYNTTAAKEIYDDFDFNITKVVEEFESVISAKVFKLPETTLILNFGLHFVTTTNFSSYKILIDEILKVIERRKASGGLKGDIIWRTSTAINKSKLKLQHKDEKRFFTYERTILFNAYATWKMCGHGIDVLDVFPLTDSYPFGTGWTEKPNDAVHYEHSVFASVETLLYHHLRTVNR